MSYRVIGQPWRYAGAVNVEDCKTTEEVMIKASLNYEVKKHELVAKMPIDVMNMDKALDDFNNLKKKDSDAHILGSNLYTTCPNTYCTYRDDYKIPLGTVKKQYTIVQNKEAFKFFDDAIGANEAKWQTAGFFGNGERIFVSAKLPDNIRVKGDIVENYLLFVNNHDGNGGVKILFTPIRVICQNTLAAALKSGNALSYKHTSSVHKNIEEAHRVLGITKQIIQATNDAYNLLESIKMTDEQVIKYICEFYLTDEEKAKLLNTGHTYKQIIYRNGLACNDAEISTRKLNIISDTWDYYNVGIGQKEIAGTAWGAYNSISGYYSNVDTAIGTKRMDSIMFGDKSRKLKEALEYEFAI